MRQFRRSATAVMIGVGSLMLITAPSFAASHQMDSSRGSSIQLAHMDQIQEGGRTGQPCPMGMMGQGMMSGSGYGHPHGHGHWRDRGELGKMGQGMMGPGRGGQDMMGSGRGGQGMMGPGFGHRVVPVRDLSADEVRHFLKHRLEMHGNKRLKVGEVKEVDEHKIVADITTIDDSLVQRLEVDRHTGQMERVE